MMIERFALPADFSPAQAQMAMAALYLCLEHTLEHVTRVEGAASAATLKHELVTALKSGDIDMSILEDTRIFDFVVPLVERLAASKIAA
jgi:hypothetical protein